MMQAEEILRQCNPDDPAFKSQQPFPVDARDFFESVEAALEFIPEGGEISFDQVLNGIILE